MVVATALLAHQGGWDEILLIAGPIVAIGLLLRVAKKRVDRLQAEHSRVDDAGGTATPARHDEQLASDPSDTRAE